jgi:hypothetical protein
VKCVVPSLSELGKGERSEGRTLPWLGVSQPFIIDFKPRVFKLCLKSERCYLQMNHYVQIYLRLLHSQYSTASKVFSLLSICNVPRIPVSLAMH